MKSLLFLLPFLSCCTVFGQKETSTVIEADGIESIVISANEIFKVEVTAAPVQDITITTWSEGEYYNDIALDIKKQPNILFLDSKFQKILNSGYDKLSAHKVFAMKIALQIPQGLQVEIRSNLASVYAKGAFKNLLVELKSGSCFLTNFTGNAIVNTYSGNIEVETKNSRVEASSRNGKVKIDKPSFGENKIILTSISGNINVKKTD